MRRGQRIPSTAAMKASGAAVSAGPMQFPGLERRTVDVAGIAISCATAGSGPPLLLLHGFPQCLAMWAKTAPLLAQKFSVVCADLRGYGDSAKPKAAADGSTYSFRSMAG